MFSNLAALVASKNATRSIAPKVIITAQSSPAGGQCQTSIVEPPLPSIQPIRDAATAKRQLGATVSTEEVAGEEEKSAATTVSNRLQCDDNICSSGAAPTGLQRPEEQGVEQPRRDITAIRGAGSNRMVSVGAPHKTTTGRTTAGSTAPESSAVVRHGDALIGEKRPREGNGTVAATHHPAPIVEEAAASVTAGGKASVVEGAVPPSKAVVTRTNFALFVASATTSAAVYHREQAARQRALEAILTDLSAAVRRMEERLQRWESSVAAMGAGRRADDEAKNTVGVSSSHPPTTGSTDAAEPSDDCRTHPDCVRHLLRARVESMLRRWQLDLTARSFDDAVSIRGREVLASALQHVTSLEALLAALERDELPDEFVGTLASMIGHAWSGNPDKATDVYFGITMGGGSWKIGTFAGGMHQRRSHEKFARGTVKHIMNNDAVRGMLYALKVVIDAHPQRRSTAAVGVAATR